MIKMQAKSQLGGCSTFNVTLLGFVPVDHVPNSIEVLTIEEKGMTRGENGVGDDRAHVNFDVQVLEVERVLPNVDTD